jgi:hypothetical protein
MKKTFRKMLTTAIVTLAWVAVCGGLFAAAMVEVLK